jgi:hypothetical protein
MRDEPTIVVVRRFSTQADAELARSALEAYGIPAAVQRGPYPQPVATYDVLVREDAVEAATDILGPEDP